MRRLRSDSGTFLPSRFAAATSGFGPSTTAAVRRLRVSAKQSSRRGTSWRARAVRSRIGQELVEDYRTHPQTRERVRRDGVRIFELPDGRGVSFNPDGSFRGLLEPRP